jgi:hypothetical protein
MSVIGSNILAGASGQAGYFLTKSLRFRSSASAYLNRTPASATNRTTWTWSGWVKRGTLGSINNGIFSAGTSFGTNNDDIQTITFNNDSIVLVSEVSGSVQYNLITTQLFRDPASWYHFVVAFDTTQATSSNRVKLYVNGSQVTAFSTSTYPSLNYDGWVNSANAHRIGNRVSPDFDGYLTEVNFIDGQALTPSSFGETSTSTGVWIPKKYTGTYGTNGFYLPFTDTASTSTLGTDFSGNSNTWTVNNISLTAGSTYDSMNDVPTLTSATTANYCVLNSLNQNSVITLSAGNLSFTASNNRFTTGTFAVTSGKWYWEFYPVAGGASGVGVGAILATTYVYGTAGFANGAGYIGVGYTSNGSKYISGTSSAYGATYGSGNVIGVSLDLDSGTKTITFYKDNTSQGSINLPTSSEAWIIATDYSEAGTHSINFGQRPFAYTPPSGFVALNTFNLPTPTIGATAATTANKYMDATLYTGNSTTNNIVNAGGMQPDLVWIKSRSNAQNNNLFDSIRGAGYVLFSNATNAETNNTANFTSFNSNGFSLASNGGDTNLSGYTYVGWQWRASNTTPVSNTAGSITSTVSASTTAGFSIVAYTGNGTNGATVGHGLGAKPFLIIEKGRTSTYNWSVQGCGELWTPVTSNLFLNGTNGLNLNGAVAAPTSTVYTPSATNYANESGITNIAYCFAPIAGYSAFGSYTGNGSSDGPFIFTGFRPRFIVIKSTGVEDWRMFDTSRSTYNIQGATLYPNTSSAENAAQLIDINSNGFKCRTTDGAVNGSGTSYIYMAFAENPFKYANAR